LSICVPWSTFPVPLVLSLVLRPMPPPTPFPYTTLFRSYGTRSAQVAFLFTRVGLAGCDMGACAMLPRVVGQGRAAELLFTGRTMTADEGERWGFFNRIVASDALEREAVALARSLADGPTFAHMMTKTMLNQEWSMTLDQAIEAEAQAQAICMRTEDFKRAFDAFKIKGKPKFSGD